MDFAESINESKATFFKDILQALISENYNKRMAEKGNLMERATLLLEMKEVQNALLQDVSGGWRRTLRTIGSLTRIECDENVKKLSMSKRSFKSSAFNLWKFAVNLQLSVKTSSSEVKLEDLTGTLSKCLSENSKVWPLIDASIWLDTIGLLSSVFNVYSTSDIPLTSLLPIWKICIFRLKKSIRDDKRSERQKLSELFETLTRNLHYTELHLQIEGVIDEFREIMDNYNWPAKDPAKTHFLEALNNLCKSYGFLQRDLLLTCFFPIAEKLFVHMNVFSPSSEQNQSFDMIQLETGRRTSTFQNSFYEFLGHVLVMSVPDCEINSLNYEPIFPVVQKCLHQIVDEVSEQISKSASVFRLSPKCILPAVKVPLVARLFVIYHLKHKSSFSGCGLTEDHSRPKKRARKSPSHLLEILISSTALVHFQILLEILRTWKHRIDQETAESISQALMKVNRNFIKEDDRLVAFLKILTELVSFKTEALVLEDVFNWALPLLHNPAAHNTVCLLIAAIFLAVDELSVLRSKYTFEVVINNISRLHVFQSGTLQLIQFLVVNYDFDEFFLFRMADLEMDDGSQEWCFRSQLIFSLLSSSETSIDLYELLLLLMSYVPNSVGDKFGKSSGSKAEVMYADLLAQFYCSKQTLTSKKNFTAIREMKAPVQVIDSLVKVCAKAIERIFHLESTEVEKKFQMWRTSTIMLKILNEFCEYSAINSLRDTQLMLDKFVLNFNVFSGERFKLVDAWELVNLQRFWDSASLQIKRYIEEAAQSGQSILYAFVVHWSKEIPDQYLKETLESCDGYCSAIVEDLLVTITDSISFFDLLRVLQSFGPKLSPCNLMFILESLMKKIDEQSLEDSVENVSNSQMTMKKTFFSAISKNINDGQQALWKTLVANEILRVLNCTKLRELCLHVVDDRWFKMNQFLVLNASSKLMAIRFGSLCPLPRHKTQVEESFQILGVRFVLKSHEQLMFLRNCLKESVLQNFHVEMLKKLLLFFPLLLCLEFIENFESLRQLYDNVLVYLLEFSGEKCLDAPVIDRSFSQKLSHPMVRYLLDRLEPLQVLHFPGMFFLPTKILLDVMQRDAFASQWLTLFQSGNCSRIFFSIREHLHQCQSGLQRALASPLILNAIILLFENFSWSALQNDDMAFLILLDVLNTSKLLFLQIINYTESSDLHLQDLYKRLEFDGWRFWDGWFKFVSKTSEIRCFCPRIYVLALQCVDPIVDFRSRFPVTWRFLSSPVESHDDNSAVLDQDGGTPGKSAIDFARMYSQEFLEESGLEKLAASLDFSSRLPKCRDSGSFDLMEGNFDIIMLRGYWHHIQMNISNEDLIESNLFFLCLLSFFFPCLKLEIAPVVSLYSTSQIKRAQDEVLRSLCSQGLLSEFIDQISRILLFRSSFTCPPNVSAALYNCSTKSMVIDGSGNSLVNIVPSVSSSDSTGYAMHDEVVDPDNFLVFLQQAGCLAPFPMQLQSFLTIARHFPIYASLLIPRVVKELSLNSTEKQCKFVVGELNVSIAALESKKVEFSEVEYTFLIAIVSLTEFWPVSMPHLSMLPLVRCLVRAKLFANAHYYLRYYMDFFFCNLPSRTMFHFQLEEEKHFLETVKDEKLREEMLKLLVKIFIGLNDPISLNVIPLTAKINNDARIFVAESNHDWGALSGLCSSSSGNDEKMAESFYYLGSESPKSCSLEAQYASALKLASWDQLSAKPKQVSFPKNPKSHWQELYRVTKLFHDRKPSKIVLSITSFLRNFRNSDYHLLDVRKLDQLRDFVILDHYTNTRNCGRQLIGNSVGSSLAILSSWELARNSFERNENLPALINVVIKRSKELRKLHSYQPALTLLDKLEKIVVSSGRLNYLPYSFIERAKILIASKESSSSSMACYFLKRVINEFDSAAVNIEACTVEDFDSFNDASEIILLKIKSHVLLSRIAPNDQKAMETLKEACNLSALLTKKHPLVCSKNYVKYAIFAEKRYRELREFSETPAFALKKEAIRQWQTEINQSTSRGSNAAKCETSRREREIQCELVDVQAVEDERNTYLKESYKFYLNALVLGSSENANPIIIHRFAALLMQNVEDVQFSTFSMEYVDRIPSHVWLPIFNILSSYLFSFDLPVAALVAKIALNVVRDYPYHCLNHLLFYLSSVDKTSEGRRKVTLSLFKKVSESNNRLKDVITIAKKAHDVLRDFARTEPSDFESFSERGKQFYKISPRKRILSELSSLQAVPIPVLTQKLTKAGNYDVSSMVSFSSIQTNFELADGLSTPKVITVIGSDGVKYKLIFKKEDIRQDGLIQQLFLVSNLLMQQSKALASVSKSFSPLRQYNVLPLDGQNGIIEWCSGTQSICGYLAGQDKKGGAHLKYRPKEPSVFDLRFELSKLDLSRPGRCRDFLAICKKISPVFRYFFYERYSQLEVFHQKINAYTRSLAQWSAVCYVVGLGDRHLTNILIDDEGELVHIDLGQVFEYSKRMLKQPEKVPFRLTREMVDPILIDGVQGKLKRIACETLKTMRENAQVLVGISSLILYDPISSLKSKLNLDKKMDKVQRNLFAECAISRLKEKLAGRDLTYAEMSAEEQMTRLIADAQNPENLCQMFAGWLAFL